MTTVLTYQEVLTYQRANRKLLEQIKANEFKTEEILREILREEDAAKGIVHEEPPYYERMGFLKQLVDVVDHFGQETDQ